MKRELEEGREHAAPVVVGLHRRASDFEKRHQGREGQLGHGEFLEVIGEPFKLPLDPLELCPADVALLAFVTFGRDVIGNGVRE